MTRNVPNAMGLLTLALLASASTAQAATVTVDLWAKPGTVLLPGIAAPVTVWGYATSDLGPATVPGPAIVVTQGDTVVVTLTNGLAEVTALDFAGQSLIPDQVGAAPGGSRTYAFTADAPGTYLYQAGLLAGAQHQAPMGLYGALVVRPASAPDVPIAGQAYAGAATAFDDEAVLVLSELDPALNGAAAPAAFDLRNYAPRYFLINGQPYPGTAPIQTQAGHRVLLRYVNAGLQHHSMALLGLNQAVVATDGRPRTYGQAVVAETVAPGQTMDAIATIPAGALAGSKFALFDGSLKLYNGTGTGVNAGFGGMLTFLTTSAAGGGTGAGPTTSAVAAAPASSNGTVDVVVTASVAADVTANPANTVAAAELFVDAPGAAGTGTAMSAVDGAFDGATEAVTGTLPAAVVGALASGTHTLYVHGQDAALAWGAFATATVTIDRAGPTVGAVALAPNPASGAVAVAVSASLTLPAGSVDAAEYFIDATGAGGTGTAMTGAFGAPTVAASGTIAAGPGSPLDTLAAGSHTVYVHGRSAGGSWGTFNFAILNLDKAGPAVTGPTLTPNPSGGAVDVALHATGSDAATGGSAIAAAEYTVDGGAAAAMAVNLPAPIASLDAILPAAALGALGSGDHVVSIRAQDAIGNWGPATSVTLTLDRVGPVTSGLVAAPNPTGATGTVRLTASATDAMTGVAAAEGFIDPGASPAAGSGFPFVASDGAFGGTTEVLSADIPQATLAQLSIGNHTVAARSRDAVGNWGALTTATLARSGVAVADTLAFNANTSTSQAVNVAAPGLLANDLPLNAAGRTAALVSGPTRTGGTGTGTIRVSCGASTTTGVCSNGSYRVTLTSSGGNAAARQASKRGTYQFTYSMTLGGITSAPATVTITVN